MTGLQALAGEYSIARIKETVRVERAGTLREGSDLSGLNMATPRLPSQPLGDCVAASEQSASRLAWCAIEDGDWPAAQIANAQLKTFEAVSEMTEAARRLFVVRPAGAKGARRPLSLPRKELSVLPAEIACGANQSASATACG
jgi:hypothetical protein